ncbi:hypothetical protein CA265_07785 [Sphingobacteriaceae bacterium GW460-11-11-14-LB5]|nr:hypothetical protein CA265_07785 [Sphingobacteriaceae bacterium GW460-11-11-14-LB5]
MLETQFADMISLIKNARTAALKTVNAALKAPNGHNSNSLIFQNLMNTKYKPILIAEYKTRLTDKKLR